jgi:hypothetical protein
MPNYTVRVELHGATGQQYEQLHVAMRNAGFYTAIRGDGGSKHFLPMAEYVVDGSPLSCSQIRDLVVQIATAVKAVPLPKILVTEAASRAWQLNRTPST